MCVGLVHLEENTYVGDRKRERERKREKEKKREINASEFYSKFGPTVPIHLACSIETKAAELNPQILRKECFK